jgi:hypothetical protein
MSGDSKQKLIPISGCRKASESEFCIRFCKDEITFGDPETSKKVIWFRSKSVKAARHSTVRSLITNRGKVDTNVEIIFPFGIACDRNVLKSRKHKK